MGAYGRVLIGVLLAGGVAMAQSPPDTVEGHVAAAKAAAGADYAGLMNRLCTAPAPPPATPRPAPGQPAAPRTAPARENRPTMLRTSCSQSRTLCPMDNF